MRHRPAPARRALPALLLALVPVAWSAVACDKKPASQNRQARRVPEGPPRWNPRIQWVGYDEARARAKKESKPICLVLYTNTCPRCRELAPLFDEADLVRLSSRLVMAKQNTRARPPWLARYRRYGTYVPKILFLDPEGQVMEGVRSGNQRYPYYYQHYQLEALKHSMVQALN